MIPCYTNSRGPFPPGFDYRNPEYFGAPTPDVEHVVVVGDWPEVIAAYEAQGTTVERIEALPGADSAADDLTREGIAKMAKADVLELLAAHGVTADAGAKVADLRAQLISVMFVEG